MVCLFCSVFHLPGHTEVPFFPEWEFLGAEKEAMLQRVRADGEGLLNTHIVALMPQK